MKIIDCHTHVYPDKIAAAASAAIGEFYGLPMTYDGSVAELRKNCKENNISACLICSVATSPAQVNSVNRFISETAKTSGGLFFALGTLHPDMTREEIIAELDKFPEYELKGVKLHPDFQKFEADTANAIYDEVQNRKLKLLIHAGDERYSFSEPFRIEKIAKQFPLTDIIAAHFGGWSVWERFEDSVEKLAEYKNVYIDTSSSLYELAPDKAEKIIHTFGAERVLFGTDYPMWETGLELERFFALDLTRHEQSLILAGNAERLFFN
jgi:predicted TIM-barrel fold metal-dependent hydrolase